MQALQYLNIPNILLGSLLALAIWVLYSASRSPRFDSVDMLLDERGKASSSRLAVFVALALSTFILAYVVINKSLDDETLLYMFGVYIMTWAGSKTLEKGVEAWSHKRPSPSRGRGYSYEEEDYGGYGGYGGGSYSPGYSRPQPRRAFQDEPDPVPLSDNPDAQPVRPIANFTPQDIPAKEDRAENSPR